MIDEKQEAINAKILDILTKLNKKVDKLTNVVTRMGKTLHLVPVTEKEEREIQIQQRTNLQIAAKVNEELDAMSPKEPSGPEMMTIFDNYEHSELFGDVLGDDFLGGSA